MNVIACRRKSRTLLCSRRGRCCCWLLVLLLLLLSLYVLALAGRRHASLDPALNPFMNPWLARALGSGSNTDQLPADAGGLERADAVMEGAGLVKGVQGGDAHMQQIELPARDGPAMMDAPPAAAHAAFMDQDAKKL